MTKTANEWFRARALEMGVNVITEKDNIEKEKLELQLRNFCFTWAVATHASSKGGWQVYGEKISALADSLEAEAKLNF